MRLTPDKTKANLAMLLIMAPSSPIYRLWLGRPRYHVNAQAKKKRREKINEKQGSNPRVIGLSFVYNVEPISCLL